MFESRRLHIRNTSNITKQQTRDLRTLLRNDGIVVAPGAYDAISAILVEQAGFPCVYLGGNALVASTLGLPDLGLITLTEVRECVRRSAACTDLPIIVDADVGYGSLLMVQRTVREFESAGASAIQIEDQTSPKKCGHELGRQVVETSEMVDHLLAAIEARRNPQTLIVARTDSRTTHGLADSIRRAHAYASAGADVIFVESPESEDEFREIAQSVPAPLLANMVESGRSPYLPWQKLEEFGFKIVIYPGSTILAAVKTVQAVLTDIREKGYVPDPERRMSTLEQYHSMLHFKEYLARESSFSYQRKQAGQGS